MRRDRAEPQARRGQYSAVSTCSTIRALGSVTRVPLDTAPHLAQRPEERFGRLRASELEVDHHVVRIVGGSQDPVAADARPLAPDGVAVERSADRFERWYADALVKLLLG